MSDRSYSLGRFLGRHWVGVLVTTAAAVLTANSYLDARTAEKRAAADAQAAAERSRAQSAELKRVTELATSCAQGGARHLEAQAQMRERAYDAAFDTLHPCRERWQSPEVKALYIRAMEASREEAAKRAQRELAEAKAAKKRRGVHLGMSQQDVLDSNWGRPERVNRTTNARGTHEQWVYGNGNYLYFQDGVLTSIQN